MIKELKKKLEEYVRISEGDEDYQKFGRDFAKDVENLEAATELMKNKFYAEVVKDLEEANEKAGEALMLCDLNKTSDSLIRQVLADWQANHRAINTLKGRDPKVLGEQLDRAIKAVKEAKEESDKNEKKAE